MTQESLRAAIGMVTQDTSLLHRSIAANIRYGRPHASDAEVIAAARQGAGARLHSWACRTGRTTGYEAHVGERGVKLSGGQRQRIALRARDPEGCADPRARRGDLGARQRGRARDPGAAPRPDGGQDGDRDRAPPVDHRAHGPPGRDRAGPDRRSGTHDELLRLGGHYEKLWRHQSGGFLADDFFASDIAEDPASGLAAWLFLALAACAHAQERASRSPRQPRRARRSARRTTMCARPRPSSARWSWAPPR